MSLRNCPVLPRKTGEGMVINWQWPMWSKKILQRLLLLPIRMISQAHLTVGWIHMDDVMCLFTPWILPNPEDTLTLWANNHTMLWRSEIQCRSAAISALLSGNRLGHVNWARKYGCRHGRCLAWVLNYKLTPNEFKAVLSSVIFFTQDSGGKKWVGALSGRGLLSGRTPYVGHLVTLDKWCTVLQWKN